MKRERAARKAKSLLGRRGGSHPDALGFLGTRQSGPSTTTGLSNEASKLTEAIAKEAWENYEDAVMEFEEGHGVQTTPETKYEKLLHPNALIINASRIPSPPIIPHKVINEHLFSILTEGDGTRDQSWETVEFRGDRTIGNYVAERVMDG